MLQALGLPTPLTTVYILQAAIGIGTMRFFYCNMSTMTGDFIIGMLGIRQSQAWVFFIRPYDINSFKSRVCFFEMVI